MIIVGATGKYYWWYRTIFSDVTEWLLVALHDVICGVKWQLLVALQRNY